MRKLVALLVPLFALAGTPVAAAAPVTHVVTAGGSIQAAVNAASPGDAILIEPGIYHQSVDVTTPNLIIRGRDRNTVELDGQNTRNIGFNITAPGVEVSNLTVHSYRRHGIFWDGTSDYLAQYVTAFNNGLYGVFAFDTQRGLMTKSYASGNADSGFYIGGCYPCDAIIEDVASVHNGLGYSGTNAGGNLVIRNSLWARNRGGILPNSLDSEPNPPQHDTIITNNVVVDSGDVTAPTTQLIEAATGIGIGVAGGDGNLISGNVISNSSRYGVAIFPFPETTPNLYSSNGNRVQDNTISGSGKFDLALAAGSGQHNCFSGNSNPAAAITSDPPMIQDLYPCHTNPPAFRALANAPVSGSPLTTADLVAGLAGALTRNGLTCAQTSCPDPRTDPTTPVPLTSMADPTAGLP